MNLPRPNVGPLALAIGLVSSLPALAASPEILRSATPLDLETVAFAGGKTLNLSVGIGSAAFHMPGDPANVIYTLSDRGPNIDCGETDKILGLTRDQACHGEKAGKVFPVPGFHPAIFKVELGTDGTFRVVETITLKDRDGKELTGISNPLTTTNTELAFDRDAKSLPLDPAGLDTEGLVRLSDGTFWLADEYGPSLVHVAADGRVLERLVPAGLEGDLAGANYTVTGSLPAILMKRTLNRGLESVALTPDEKSLYLIMQNPLANPNGDAYKNARATRLLRYDLAAQKVAAEYVYLIDPQDTFRLDKADAQNAVRISEMIALDSDHVIVLERINKTTKLQLVSVAGATDILGSAWDDTATSPSLEQLDEAALTAQTVKTVTKSTWLDSSDYEGIPAKIEGITFVSPDTLVLINDDDFSIEGAHTEIIRLSVSAPKTN